MFFKNKSNHKAFCLSQGLSRSRTPCSNAKPCGIQTVARRGYQNGGFSFYLLPSLERRSFLKCQPGILVIDRQSIVILGVLLVVSSPQLSSRRSFVLSWSYSLFLVLDLHGRRTMFTCSPFCCVVMFAARGIWWLTLTHIIMEPKKGRLQTNTIPFFLGLCLSAFVDYNELWSLMFAYFCRHWFYLMLALNRQIDCEKSWHTAIARWRLRQLSGAMVRMQAAVVGDPHQLLLILAYVHVDFLELAFNPTFVLTFQLT